LFSLTVLEASKMYLPTIYNNIDDNNHLAVIAVEILDTDIEISISISVSIISV
jgi:hypothetical protein